MDANAGDFREMNGGVSGRSTLLRHNGIVTLPLE